MDDRTDTPPAAGETGAPPTDAAPAETTPAETTGEAPAGAPPNAAAGQPRGPRRRRRRRRGPRQAPAEAPRLGSAVAEAEASTEGEAGSGDTAVDGNGRPILKLRNFRRRRRRLAHAPGLRPGSGDKEPAPEGGEAATAGAASPEDGAAAEGENPARPDQAASPPRRRRRRRRGPRPEGTATEAGAAAAGEGAGDRSRGRNQFGRRPRPRREGEETRQAPGVNRERRERGPGGERRDRRDRRDRGDNRGRGRGPGSRGPERRVERKLYSVDSVVDRGFEDVDSDGETRRVHWTIVKRTVADQISRKPVSASYVLQRDGSDTEFPSLGAARDAVNKTIVHPEKLTPSKSEIAALKGSSR